MKQLAAIAILMGSIALAHAAPPALQYKENIRGPAPIPPSEQALQTITAEPWFKVSDEGLQLEGPAFDTEGNLYFVEVFGGQVFRLTPDKTMTIILGENELSPAGLAIHRDGRLYIGFFADQRETGRVCGEGRIEKRR